MAVDGLCNSSVPIFGPERQRLRHLPSQRISPLFQVANGQFAGTAGARPRRAHPPSTIGKLHHRRAGRQNDSPPLGARSDSRVHNQLSNRRRHTCPQLHNGSERLSIRIPGHLVPFIRMGRFTGIRSRAGNRFRSANHRDMPLLPRGRSEILRKRRTPARHHRTHKHHLRPLPRAVRGSRPPPVGKQHRQSKEAAHPCSRQRL